MFLCTMYVLVVKVYPLNGLHFSVFLVVLSPLNINTLVAI